MTESELVGRILHEYERLGEKPDYVPPRIKAAIRAARGLLLDATPHLEGPARRVQLVSVADSILSTIIPDEDLEI